uniref:Uncharacterized protein n=1 Tax=Salmo trutta TaxID=8032 RepID=A0A673YPS6_SALTR
MQFEKVMWRETWGQLWKRTDEHVREYLIYRGFTRTQKHLNSDIKADKEKGFPVDKIIDHRQLFIHNVDLNGLKDYWGYLDRRLFCSLFRHYVVYGVQRQAQELQGQSEWRDWFILQFITCPQWSDTFLVLLHNFLSVLFQCMHILLFWARLIRERIFKFTQDTGKDKRNTPDVTD